MYEETIKALRCLESHTSCDGCKYHDGLTCNPNKLSLDAADAIEKLNRIIYLLESDRDAERELRLYAEGQIPRWIPVTERVPEPYKPVLCYGHNGIMVDYYSGDNTELFNTPLFMLCEGKVTHWQSLPEPPKEEK